MSSAETFCAEHDISTVELATVDTVGALRGKRIPAAAFSRAVSGPGIGVSSGLFCLDYALGVVGGGGYDWTNGYPDVFLVPDLATIRPVPWRPGAALVFCDVTDRAGAPVPLDPRHVLRRAQQRCVSAGFEPRVATETEFYLVDRDSLRPRAARNPIYSLHDDSYLWPVVEEICAALTETGIEVEAAEAEYGAGQVEINTTHLDPLTAADNLIFFRYTVKQVAARHGYLATFMAKPWPDSSGSGLHIHQSLRDRDSGDNIFWDESTGGLSDAARWYLAGLLEFAAETHHIAVPTPNGYKRSVDYSFAPTRAAWGYDNRSVAVRALVHGPAGTRLENRVAAADANPHFLIATQLLAGLTGLDKQLEPPPAVSTDVYTDHPADGGDALPRSVSDAVARLRPSTFARSALGDEVTDLLCVLGQGEVAAYAGDVSDWERRRYLEAV